MPAKTTRVRLSAGQKLALYSHCNQHPELALRALAAWAGSAFKLWENPSPAAVLMLLKHSATEDDARSNPTRKANQPVHCLSLEKAFVRWIERCEKIRCALVRDAEHAFNTKLWKMVFSDGWIQKLQERHNLKPRCAHGKAVSARVIDVEEGRATLQLITRKYRHRDIFNMSEFAYFYCTASPPSVSRSSATGRKNTKKRLRVAATTNADGSFKALLIFVGTARKPRYFGAHMAAEFVTGRTRVTQHRAQTHLKPQDTGITKSFKSQLNRIRDKYVVDKFDAMLKQVDGVEEEDTDKGVEQLYNVRFLVAMRWAQQAWNTVTKATAVNCWRHTGILATDIYELVSGMDKLCIAPEPAN